MPHPLLQLGVRVNPDSREGLKWGAFRATVGVAPNEEKMEKDGLVSSPKTE